MGVPWELASTTTPVAIDGATQVCDVPQSCEGGQPPQVCPQPSSPQVFPLQLEVQLTPPPPLALPPEPPLPVVPPVPTTPEPPLLTPPAPPKPPVLWPPEPEPPCPTAPAVPECVGLAAPFGALQPPRVHAAPTDARTIRNLIAMPLRPLSTWFKVLPILSTRNLGPWRWRGTAALNLTFCAFSRSRRPRSARARRPACLRAPARPSASGTPPAAAPPAAHAAPTPDRPRT
jgi:hypothetical protein